MSKRVTLLIAIVALFGLVLAPSAVQAGKFQQNVSGGFTDTAIDTNGDGMAANIMTGATSGTGGTASYNGVLEIKFAATGLCPAGEIEGVVVAYSIVRRYGDGDLLFSRLVDGTTCFNPAMGKATIDINAEVFGGTGKYASASGTYSAHYDVAALLPDGQGGLAHAAFSGSATGTLD